MTKNIQYGSLLPVSDRNFRFDEAFRLLIEPIRLIGDLLVPLNTANRIPTRLFFWLRVQQWNFHVRLNNWLIVGRINSWQALPRSFATAFTYMLENLINNDVSLTQWCVPMSRSFLYDLKCRSRFLQWSGLFAAEVCQQTVLICWKGEEIVDKRLRSRILATHMKLNDKSSMLVCAHVQNPVKYIIDQYAGKGTKSISFRKLSSKFWGLLKRTKLSYRIRAFKVLKKLNFKDDQSFDWKLSVELSCIGSFKACKGNKLIITGYVCK